ncbi:MAG: phosphonate C-P lyase system protein PhnG [Pseudomonadota bacterium]
MTRPDASPEARKAWIGLLAKAPPASFAALLRQAGLKHQFTWLRQPEIGSVMVQGRMGGNGSAFNLGEITVTRCSLQLACGTVGHGYVQGRDKAKAERAALCDALLQTDEAGRVTEEILTPLASEMAEAARSRAAKSAATKVDFFTMVRGED